MNETRFGTFDELMAQTELAMRDIARRVREHELGEHRFLPGRIAT